eukprot:gnl/TRDRNA2_/TRDRNA2_128317_c2_seq1.p1 gnl/TRDRNA2_/TRDRNA2_128317_c2~~gnl/TRDRNA2_/TRDRNA2_128317_c2_seq1.p1  ORF type:complete len:244 (-),score=32.30 gnl/TRDRNA2_/TRDRNA2_128317_c2_seq1:203-856(-)
MMSAAETALEAGQPLKVAIDAEWGASPDQLSLLQLAVDVSDGNAPTIFLLDMLDRPSESTLQLCRRLLLGELSSRAQGSSYEVLVFSPRSDLPRLVASGILPSSLAGVNARDIGWIDMQQLDLGLGTQPGLQKVVRHCLGVKLEKRMQKSDWDRRPLSVEQIEYAALDASCLLRLRAHQPIDDCIMSIRKAKLQSLRPQLSQLSSPRRLPLARLKGF